MMLPMSLFALAIAAFGIGTTEFVIMGLLPDVARDLGVSIPSAGMLIGGYALGVTFGGPVVAMAMSGLSRKQTLLALMSVFTLGNLLCALAPNYELLLAARLLTALCHGTFFGIGTVVATTLVPPAQRSRAIAVVFAGLTVANVLGVPLGTALGQWAGWRSTFLAIVPIGLFAAFAIWRWLPATQRQPALRPWQEIQVLARPAVLLPMLVSVLASASLFATFTYIAPLLETASGISAGGVTSVLLLFGIGMTAGNLLGGRLADWRQLTAIIGALVAVVVIMVVLSQIVFWPVGATIGVAIWGVVQFIYAPCLQSRVVEAAAGAPNLASVMNQSAFNLGNFLGAWLGAQALEAGIAYAHLPLLSAALAIGALTLVLCDAMLARRRLAFGASGLAS